jgi:hypothetical protein
LIGIAIRVVRKAIASIGTTIRIVGRACPSIGIAIRIVRKAIAWIGTTIPFVGIALRTNGSDPGRHRHTRTLASPPFVKLATSAIGPQSGNSSGTHRATIASARIPVARDPSRRTTTMT